MNSIGIRVLVCGISEEVKDYAESFIRENDLTGCSIAEASDNSGLYDLTIFVDGKNLTLTYARGWLSFDTAHDALDIQDNEFTEVKLQ